ncbi:unnamed protein product [Lampetra planeri]
MRATITVTRVTCKGAPAQQSALLYLAHAYARARHNLSRVSGGSAGCGGGEGSGTGSPLSQQPRCRPAHALRANAAAASSGWSCGGPGAGGGGAAFRLQAADGNGRRCVSVVRSELRRPSKHTDLLSAETRAQ